MYKHLFLAVSLAAMCTVSSAQTKRIAHRSHSGSNISFSTKGTDNFGLPPESRRKPVKDTAKAATPAKADSTKRKAPQPASKDRPKKKPAPKKKETVTSGQ